ncbi:MAG: prolyl oligopeptidase family serine peptidase [Deltaproteobacteria bacterium]|nr:prolyl oligopeptidase family serine peptidase [Deltaproteobacteria bacterium]
MRSWLLLLVVLLAGCATIQPPAAPRGALVETHHGVEVADPYRWMEAMDSADTRAWVLAEDELARAYLKKLPGRAALRQRILELRSYERFGIPVHAGGRYFWGRHDGQQGMSVVFAASSLDATPAMVLDPNTFSTDGSLAYAGMVASQDGKHLAYGVSAGGGDWQTWHVRDLATGRDLPDRLEHVKYYHPVFAPGGGGLYYSRFPAPAAGKELTETDHDCKVYFHELGTPADRDVVVLERPDQPTWQFDLALRPDGRYLVITTGDGQVGDRGQEQISYLDLDRPGAPVVPLIATYDAEYVFVGNQGPVFYFKTTLDAPRKRLIAIDTRSPAPGSWRTVVPEGAEVIDDAHLVGQQLLVSRLRDAHVTVTAYDLSGAMLRDIALPGLGTAWGFDGGPGDRETFYYFTGFTIPGAIYRLDLATGKSTLWKSPRVPFDPSRFETKQVFFASKDGTRVPMFVTALRGLALDGTHPTVMTAYGFGGVPMLPVFDPAMIAWLERGGISVLVNIRGGGEYGEAWHQASVRTSRQVGRDDFIAAGEWLVASGYTSPARLGMVGGSGGGLLVGGVLVQRPDLFGAAVPMAGVLDLLRFQLFGQGAGWQGDLGSPDDPVEFAALLKLSPLHNARPARYPATLVITADHDVRVAPLHSYKFVAALRNAQLGPAPILLRVETQSGHGGGSTQAQKVDQNTDVLIFFAHHLGLGL